MSSRRRSAFPLAVCVTAVLWGSTSAEAAAPTLLSSTFLGGDGADIINGVAIAIDGTIVVGGSTTSKALAGTNLRALGGTAGFVVRLDRDGRTVLTAVGLSEEVRDVELDADGEIFALGKRRLYKLDAQAQTITMMTADFGADARQLAVNGDTAGIVAGPLVMTFDTATLTQRLRMDIKKSTISGVAVDNKGNVLVCGDQDTNTGLEPYRSPYVYRFTSGGVRDAKIYDIAGPDVHSNGVELQADSSFRQLYLDREGKVWFTAQSDGGNTVLAHSPTNIKADQPALMGACYDGACFGYKGTKKTGLLGMLNDDSTDFARASWIVPFALQNTLRNMPPCGCKSAPNGPSSAIVSGLAFDGSQVIVVGNAGSRPPETSDAWFFDAASGSAFVIVMDRQLKAISFATLIPGTTGGEVTPRVASRDGRLVIVGDAEDTSGKTATAPFANPHYPTWPAGLALQNKYAGGTTDGFVVVACLTGTCQGATPLPPPADPPDASVTPEGTAGKPGATGGGPSDPIAGASGATPRDLTSTGCMCHVGHTAQNSGAGVGLLLLLSLAGRLAKRTR